MVSNFNKSFYQLNKFLKKMVFKKVYIKKVKNRILFLNKVLKQNYKKLNSKTILSNKVNFLIAYIIRINFSKANTFAQITNSFGTLKQFYSAGSLLCKGKSKKARTFVLKKLTTLLIKKLKTLKNKTVVLQLKNTGFKKNWITDRLGEKTIIKTAVGFNLYSHNGCRKKKVCSKKI